DVVIVQATTTGIARAPAFLVKDINATFVPRSSSPGGFVTVGGTTFFSASTPETGFELWKLDGLETGPVVGKDINPGPGDSAPSGFTILDDRLFFVADSGAGLPEIWNSDGTSAGTRRVTSVGDLAITCLTEIDGTLFFVARSRLFSQAGALWKS